jgi:hypothetical protein
MAVNGSIFRYEALRSLAFGSISGTYAAIGVFTAPAVSQFEVINNTDALLIFSFDGIDDHFALPAYTQKIVDICANNSNNHLFLGARQYLYVKDDGSAPTVGKVYFSTAYNGTTDS